jgi:hypothetical protein
VNYQKRIVCLANSKKPGGRCVAGKLVTDGTYGEWIRPVSARPSAEISFEERQYEDGKEPDIFDVIGIPMIAHVPRLHQTENHMIDADLYWAKQGVLTWDDLAALCDSPACLWENGDSTYHGSNDRMTQEVAAPFRNSLWLIKPKDVIIQVFAPGAAFGNPKRRVRAGFRYYGIYYDFMVTDLRAEQTFLAKPNGVHQVGNDLHFCVSLTEAHTDGYCYKLIATVFSKQPPGGN